MSIAASYPGTTFPKINARSSMHSTDWLGEVGRVFRQRWQARILRECHSPLLLTEYLAHTSGGQERRCGKRLMVVTNLFTQMGGNASLSDRGLTDIGFGWMMAVTTRMGCWCVTLETVCSSVGYLQEAGGGLRQISRNIFSS